MPPSASSFHAKLSTGCCLRMPSRLELLSPWTWVLPGCCWAVPELGGLGVLSTCKFPRLTTRMFVVPSRMKTVLLLLQTQAILGSKQSGCLCWLWVLNPNSIYQMSSHYNDLHELILGFTGSGRNWASVLVFFTTPFDLLSPLDITV